MNIAEEIKKITNLIEERIKMTKCAVCDYDDHGTGDNAHVCRKSLNNYQNTTPVQEQSAQSDFVFPEITGGFPHPTLGVVYDRFAMHQYAAKCIEIMKHKIENQEQIKADSDVFSYGQSFMIDEKHISLDKVKVSQEPVLITRIAYPESNITKPIIQEQEPVVCEECDGKGEVETGIGMMDCCECSGRGFKYTHSAPIQNLELVGQVVNENGLIKGVRLDVSLPEGTKLYIKRDNT